MIAYLQLAAIEGWVKMSPAFMRPLWPMTFTLEVALCPVPDQVVLLCDMLYPVLLFHFSGIKMTGVSKMSLLNFVVFARFLALIGTIWQANKHRTRQYSQELTMNQSKTTVFRSRNLQGLVFLSPEFFLFWKF